MCRCDTERWTGARQRELRRSRQTKQSGCAFHISVGHPRPVRRRRECRNTPDGHIATPRHEFTESREMNLLGKLSWDAIPFDQPIVMGASGGVILAAVLILGWITV